MPNSKVDHAHTSTKYSSTPNTHTALFLNVNGGLKTPNDTKAIISIWPYISDIRKEFMKTTEREL